jgi:hypothetical protein
VILPALEEQHGPKFTTEEVVALRAASIVIALPPLIAEKMAAKRKARQQL